MTALVLASKRLVRSVAFVISLAVLALCIIGAALCDKGFVSVSAGIVCEGDSMSTAVASGLAQYGFEKYENRQALSKAVSDGQITCGIVLANDFEERVKSANLENAAEVILTPDAIFPEIFKMAAMAEILSVAAPYITSASFLYGDITADTVARYEKYTANGALFKFETLYLGGGAAQESSFAVSLAVAAAAICIFASALLQAGRLESTEYLEISNRIGKKTAFKAVFLPELAVWAISAAVSVAISAGIFSLIAGNTALLSATPALLAYIILSAALGMALSLVIKARHLPLLIVPTLLLTAVLCPVFIDFSAAVPSVSVLRFFLPTYYAFYLQESTIPLLISVIVLLFSLYLYKEKAR